MAEALSRRDRRGQAPADEGGDAPQEQQSRHQHQHRVVAAALRHHGLWFLGI